MPFRFNVQRWICGDASNVILVWCAAEAGDGHAEMAKFRSLRCAAMAFPREDGRLRVLLDVHLNGSGCYLKAVADVVGTCFWRRVDFGMSNVCDVT